VEQQKEVKGRKNKGW